MKQRPARQSLNVGQAHALEIDANGDVVVFARDKVVVHRWDTGKTEKHPWSSEGPRWTSAAALAGAETIVAATWVASEAREEYAIYGREPFEQRRVLPRRSGAQRANEIVASLDGRLFAIVRGGAYDRPFVEVFTLDGERVQSIESVAVLGVAFSEDSSELYCFATDKVHRFAIGSRAASGFVGCELPNWSGPTLITRSRGQLLFTWRGFGATRPAFVFDEATLKVVKQLDDAHVYSWGTRPNTLVRARGAEVEVIDLSQKRLAGFRRDRATALNCAAPHPSGFWCAAGGFLELYDFNQLGEVANSAPPAGKKRASPKPPRPLAASRDQLAQGDQLLAKIWADPGDEAALRVYADWLCEHGAETRGQYIQLMLAERRDPAQTKRAKSLLKRYRGEWLGAARPFVRSWLDAGWPPGFVEYAVCEAAKLVEGFEHVCKLGPALHLTVTAIGKQRRETEKKLAALPLHRFAHLNLASNGLDDKSLATLAPALRGVRQLSLENNLFTAKGLAAVAEQGGPFEELRLFVNHRAGPAVAGEYVRVITSAPALAGLKRLHFGGLHEASLLPQLRKKLKHLEELTA